MEKITNSITARDAIDRRIAELRLLPYNNDLQRYASNLYAMITELSRIEVYARRTPPRSRYNVQCNKLKADVQTGIAYLDHLILMQRLMG